jgi:hypothetical protein
LPPDPAAKTEICFSGPVPPQLGQARSAPESPIGRIASNLDPHRRHLNS